MRRSTRCAPRPAQKNSAIFAARLGVFFSDRLGVEIEGGVIPTEPSTTVFDVIDIVARAQLVYKFVPPEKPFVPFVVIGGGFMHVAYTVNSDIIRKETDWMPHVGVGVAYKTGGGWGVRADARLILPPSSQGGITEDYEVLLSLSREFGGKHPTPEVVEEVKPKTADVDNDGDGIPDAQDKCPKEAEDKDGFQDDDGCPDPDNDGDGIPDAADKCPNEAEDKDGFQDDDGCPDPDNDSDGVPDADDKCPDEPETKNGFQDEDGCPDEIPAKLKQFTGVDPGHQLQDRARPTCSPASNSDARQGRRGAQGVPGPQARDPGPHRRPAAQEGRRSSPTTRRCRRRAPSR